MAWTDPRTWTDGELVTAAIMNPHIRDNLNATGPHLIVRKTADESVTSSTVLQDDDVLLLAIAANEIWHFQIVLLAVGSAGDMKVGLTFPTAATVQASGIGPAGAGATAFNDLSSSTSPVAGLTAFLLSDATLANIVTIQGVIVNGANAGNLRLQWAQQTSNASATIVKANSTLWAVKLA